ncbi:MAG TPA: EFR1 family ferrodoxin [Bacteroidales bacterium]|nr:EFR1 family ferrodoxin [Bacteroidales bacterium]
MDKPYQELIIYYLSGTGNAMTSSRWMAEKATEKGLTVQLMPVDRQKFIEKPDVKGRALVGFCYPTHGFGAPWLILKFFWRFPKIKNADVFLSSTRAGSKLSKLFLPGMSGVAMWIPFIILLLKGYKIKGMLPVDLPSNWISIHPGYREKVIASMFRRCEGIVKRFADRVTDGKRFFHYWVFVMLPLDIAIIPITFAYQLYGRFFLAKLFIATDKCNACGICYEKCPANAIRMYGGKPYWTLHCESCMRCINLCPEKAIQVSHLLLAMIFITVSALPIYALIFRFFGTLPDPAFKITESLLNWGLTLLMYILIYAVVFFLLRFKIFNLLFEYTSLTRYWRKYKAPGVKAGDYKMPGSQKK